MDNSKTLASKDERIRKKLIEYFNYYREDREWWEGITPRDIISYLEMQKPSFRQIHDGIMWDSGLRTGIELGKKEKKPSISIDQLKSMMLQYLQEAANEKDDSDIEADTEKWARKILGYGLEQKPVEWSDEGDIYVRALVTMIEGAESVRIWLKQQALSPEGLVDWLKSLSLNRKKTNEDVAKLSSNEWSEEDERIRKFLIKLVNDGLTCFPGSLMRSDVLTYLEKQKEQNKCPEFCSGHCVGCEMNEQNPILEVFGFKVGDAVRLKDGDGRKHIIKSFEEVEGIHGPNFYHVEFEDNSAKDGIYPGEEYPNGYYTQMEKFEEEQKPRLIGEDSVEKKARQMYETGQTIGKQKPAEWSEEDEEALDMCLDVIPKKWKTKSGILLTKWLKDNIHLQSKQEWSEEDERNIRNLESVLYYAKHLPDETRTELGNFLKSLRPHLSDEEIKKIRSEEYTKGFNDAAFGGKAWKPTELQMEALEFVIRDYREDSCNATANYLQEILDHLKNM